MVSVEVGSRWSILYRPTEKDPARSRKFTVASLRDLGGLSAAECFWEQDEDGQGWWMPVADFALDTVRPLGSAL